MSYFLKAIVLGAVFIVLSACNCKPIAVISVMRDGDKNLSCKDISNEMLQAEFYRDEARARRGIDLKQSLAPLCWYGSYTNADEAVSAAEKRVRRLEEMYERKQCATRSDEAPPASAPGRPSAPAPAAAAPVSQAPTQPMRSNDPNLHIHVLPNGAQFMHSHPSSGAHTHLPDGTIRPVQ